MRLVGDILSEPSLQSGHLALVDIHEGLLNETKTAVENLVGYAGGKFTVSAHTEVKAALNGADFVFFTFATGGYERWKNDIEICTSHGVLQSVGDTIGPGGIIRTLRTIPAVLDIAGEMEKRCPGAWIINYSNPEGAVCLALQNIQKSNRSGCVTALPILPAGLRRKSFRWTRQDCISAPPASIILHGLRILRLMASMSIRSLWKSSTGQAWTRRSRSRRSCFARMAFILRPGTGMSASFSVFLKDQVLLDHDYAWKNNDFAAIDGWRSNLRQLFDEVRVRNTGYEKFLEGSGETATHFIRALVTGETASEMVNVINRGYIENISNGVIVELPAFIDSFGLHPQKLEPFRTASPTSATRWGAVSARGGRCCHVRLFQSASGDVS